MAIMLVTAEEGLTFITPPTRQSPIALLLRIRPFRAVGFAFSPQTRQSSPTARLLRIQLKYMVVGFTLMNPPTRQSPIALLQRTLGGITEVE